MNIDNANKVADAINQKHGAGTAKGFGVDATNEESVIKLAQDVDNTFNRTDLMVYSAGVAKAAPITNFALSDFQLSVNVNLTGYFLCAREFAKLMLKHKTAGRIIQINSKSGKVGSKHNSGYSAAKFGGVGLTQSLALIVLGNQSILLADKSCSN